MRVIMEQEEIIEACREWLKARGLTAGDVREIRATLKNNRDVYAVEQHVIEFNDTKAAGPYR